jgi:hypothetical protein
VPPSCTESRPFQECPNFLLSARRTDNHKVKALLVPAPEDTSRMYRYIIILVWIVVGLYFGIGGWLGSKVLEKSAIAKSPSKSSEEPAVIYDGISFRDKASLNEFLAMRPVEQWFPWLRGVPDVIAPLITAASFGLIGGAAMILRKVLWRPSAPPAKVVLGAPVFSAIIACMIYMLFLVVPAAFSTGNNPVRTETLVGFSFLGGFFSEDAYTWIEDQVVKKLFPKRKK